MHISGRSLALAVAGLAALAPTALASPAQTLTNAAPAATWTGPHGLGANVSFFLDSLTGTGTCSGDVADPQTACDKTLVRVNGIVGEGSTVTFRIEGFQPVSDFDLRVYTADADGNEDTYLGSPTSSDVSESSPLEDLDPRYTGVGDFENKVVDVSAFADPDTGEIDQYFLVEVPYFLVNHDTYDGLATLAATEFVAPDPVQ